jgi:plastocyanin
MDTKTKIHTMISIVLVTLIAGIVYWMQLPTEDLKAQVIDETDTVLVRITDYAFDPDIVRINTNTTVSWLHDETEANADVQHLIASYDPEGEIAEGALFESDYLTLGDTFSHTFDEEGVYYYNDGIYQFMTGKVCVGAASEALDDDCAIDVTVPAGAEGDDLAVEEEVLEEELETELEEEFEEDEPEEVAEDEDEDLFPAAMEDEEELDVDIEDVDEEEEAEDEVFVPETEEEDEDGVLVLDMQENGQTRTADEQQEELTDSGPEDLLYIPILLFAFYAARKFSKQTA